MGRDLDLSSPRLGRVLLPLAFGAALAACAAQGGSDAEPPTLAPALTADELTALRVACPEGSRACRERHMDALASVPRPPRLARLTLDEGLDLAAACTDAQQYGPAELRRCQDRTLGEWSGSGRNRSG
jgi:hypothetical protein